MAQAPATQKIQPKAPSAPVATRETQVQTKEAASAERKRNRKPGYMSQAHSTPMIEVGNEGSKRMVLNAVPTDFFTIGDFTQPTKKDFANEDLYLEFKLSVQKHALNEQMREVTERETALKAVQSEGSPELRTMKRSEIKLQAQLEKIRAKLQAAKQAS